MLRTLFLTTLISFAVNATANNIMPGGFNIIGDGLLEPAARHPFSFTYGGKSSSEVLANWKFEKTSHKLDADRTLTTVAWRDPDTGLKVTCESIRYSDFPAVEWVLYFKNAGSGDTPIIQDVQALDIVTSSPFKIGSPYRLDKSHGGTPDPQQFEPAVLDINAAHPQVLESGEIRGSSDKDFPFFKIEMENASLVIAVGWSGTWKAKLECSQRGDLHVRAGIRRTHFMPHPGEEVRSPRMLVLDWQGDTLESNAQFRQLIYKHYAARRDGKTPLPIPFCNTCFTRGGGWLNECNAENQISLIKAYSKLGPRGAAHGRRMVRGRLAGRSRELEPAQRCVSPRHGARRRGGQRKLQCSTGCGSSRNESWREPRCIRLTLSGACALRKLPRTHTCSTSACRRCRTISST